MIEFHTLPDPVRTAAKNQYCRLGPRLYFTLGLISSVVIWLGSGKFSRAGVNRFDNGTQRECVAQLPDGLFTNAFNLGDLGVRETKAFDESEHVDIEFGGGGKFVRRLAQYFDLSKEPWVYPTGSMDSLDGGTCMNGALHKSEPVFGRHTRRGNQLSKGYLVERRRPPIECGTLLL
ncbi:hypothetical protein GALL_544160 [mine drainage metagenome]|uniref:Uncharacterized protein n=1 Tax=mine drainage metagenome TaxID=410659 RepID=A0A1J5P981_9ZZZZ